MPKQPKNQKKMPELLTFKEAKYQAVLY